MIDEILEKQLERKAAQLGVYLRNKLESLKDLGVIREVRGKGVLLGVELVKDAGQHEPFPELGKTLKRTALANGLMMRIDPTWFAVAPPLIANESDMDELVALIRKSLLEALELIKK